VPACSAAAAAARKQLARDALQKSDFRMRAFGRVFTSARRGVYGWALRR
jgi:hypothetical protein